MYADDTQLYLPFDPANYEEAIQKTEDYLRDMKDWVAKNHLKLIEDKTELMMIGQKSQTQMTE